MNIFTFKCNPNTKDFIGSSSSVSEEKYKSSDLHDINITDNIF